MFKTVFLLSMLALPTLGVGMFMHANGHLLVHSREDRTTDAVAVLSQPKIFANGVVEGRQREVDLCFELSGRIVSVDVKDGDEVVKGQTLARLDPTIWKLACDKAQARLSVTRAALEGLEQGARLEKREHASALVDAATARADLARRNYERTAALIESNVESRSQLDQHEGEHQAAIAQLAAARAYAEEVNAPARQHEVACAKAEIALARAELEHACTMLKRTELKAPTGGVVLQVHVERGEIVGSSLKIPIITMVDDSKLRVRAYVEEYDALSVMPGQSAYVTCDSLAGLGLPGVVESCAPGMVPKSRFSHRPEEHIDVVVREIVIDMDRRKDRASLVVGLPVDVYIDRDPLPKRTGTLSGSLEGKHTTTGD